MWENEIRTACKARWPAVIAGLTFLFLLVLLQLWKGEVGVGNEQRNFFFGGSGYASLVGWGNPVFLLLRRVWRMYNILTEYAGATWRSFLFPGSILSHWSHLCHVYTDTKEQCLGVPAGSLLGRGSFQVTGSWEVRQEKAYLCVGGASSGGRGLAPPKPTRALFTAWQVLLLLLIDRDCQESRTREGNVGGEPERAACRQEAGSLHRMGKPGIHRRNEENVWDKNWQIKNKVWLEGKEWAEFSEMTCKNKLLA